MTRHLSPFEILRRAVEFEGRFESLVEGPEAVTGPGVSSVALKSLILTLQFASCAKLVVEPSFVCVAVASQEEM